MMAYMFLEPILAFLLFAAVVSANTPEITKFMEGKHGIGFHIPAGQYYGSVYKLDPDTGEYYVGGAVNRWYKHYQVEDFVDDLEDMGASWLQFTLSSSAAGDTFLAPHPKLTEISPYCCPIEGEDGSDLFERVANAVRARGIAFFVYVATEGPAKYKHGEGKAHDVMLDANGDQYSPSVRAWKEYAAEEYADRTDLTEVQKEHYAFAEDVVGYYAEKYADIIDGYWFDHASWKHGNISMIHTAIKRYDPTAVLAFNNGDKVPLINNNPGYEDYTFGHPEPIQKEGNPPEGEQNLGMFTAVEDTADTDHPGYVTPPSDPDGALSLGHAFLPIGRRWDAVGTERTWDVATAVDRHSRMLGANGCITWNFPRDTNPSPGVEYPDPNNAAQMYNARYSSSLSADNKAWFLEMLDSLPSSEPSVSSVPSESSAPSSSPSTSLAPSISVAPSSVPSATPSDVPTRQPSQIPSLSPSRSVGPSVAPSNEPSALPSFSPGPSSFPSLSVGPSAAPSTNPSNSEGPTSSHTPSVSSAPSVSMMPSWSGMPSLSTEPSLSDIPSLSLEPSASAVPTLSGMPSFSDIPSLSMEPSTSDAPSIRSDAPSYSSAPSVSAVPSILSEVPSLSLEPSASAVPSYTSVPSASAAPSTLSDIPSLSVEPSASSIPSTLSNAPSVSIEPSSSYAPSQSILPSTSHSPSDEPSTAPSQSERPSNQPSENPAAQPRTSAPSVSDSPSESPAAYIPCEDDNSFRFRTFRGRRGSCSLLGRVRPVLQELFCSRQEVQDGCQLTCGQCSTTCEDDPDYISSGRPVVSCQRVSRVGSRRASRFCEDPSTSSACPVACGTCGAPGSNHISCWDDNEAQFEYNGEAYTCDDLVVLEQSNDEADNDEFFDVCDNSEDAQTLCSHTCGMCDLDEGDAEPDFPEDVFDRI